MNSSQFNSNWQSMSRSEKILAIFAALVTIFALPYYLGAFYDRVTGTGHGSAHVEEAFVPIITNDMKWIEQEWMLKGHDHAVIEITKEPMHLAVKIFGIGIGGVEWQPTEVSKTGLVYRGCASCIEHGGPIDESATLTLNGNNTMSLSFANTRLTLIPKQKAAPPNTPNTQGS